MIFEIVLGLGLLVCFFMAFLMYTSAAPFLVKLIAMPTAVVYLIMCVYLIVVLSGAPIKNEPEGVWTYVHHEVVGDNIVLWAYWGEENKHRLYEFEYDREKAKKLNEAKEGRKKGVAQNGEFKNPPEGNGRSQIILDRNAPEPHTNYVK
jgi:hypothetical protein